MPEAIDTDPLAGSRSELEERPLSTPVSVNWHVWPRCNYACRFCFATFPDIRQALRREEALKIPVLLRDAGTDKLTFVGGEPTLCPYLLELLRESKRVGLTTMIVTNGYLLADGYLDQIRDHADWIALSVDSASNETEKTLGRGYGNHVDRVLVVAKKIKEAGIHLKVNTTVTALTWQEDLHLLIRAVGPERWKVFQALSIRGENDDFGPANWITPDQFRAFLSRHADLEPIGEDNEAMTGSYVMPDPLGRFFQNFGGVYRYSDSVLEKGVLAALEQVGWDAEKFVRRKAFYDWKTPGGV